MEPRLYWISSTTTFRIFYPHIKHRCHFFETSARHKWNIKTSSASYCLGLPECKHIKIQKFDHLKKLLIPGELDFLAPDIYLPDFPGESASYTRSGNPLFIPEGVVQFSLDKQIISLGGYLLLVDFGIALDKRAYPGAGILIATSPTEYIIAGPDNKKGIIV